MACDFPFTLGIYVIEVNIVCHNLWVLDTSCGSHICLICRAYGMVGSSPRESSTYEWVMVQEL